MRLIIIAAYAAIILAAPSEVFAAGDVVKIGVLNDQSGVFSDGTGRGSTIAAQLAAEDFGGTVAGKRIEIIAADHLNKADVGSSIARQWFDQDGVDAIADLGNSAVALAVNEVARSKNKVILVSAGGATALTGAQCAPGTVQWTYDTWSQAYALVTALADRGEKTWFFITADYAFGHSLQNEATRFIENSGGKVLGAVAHPLNTLDFSSFLLQADASGARVIALANGGDDTARSLSQAREFGMADKEKFAALTGLIIDINAMGLKSTQGLLLVEAFYWDMNDATRKFSERWKARYGKEQYPTMMQAGVYGAVLHYLKAVQSVGSAEDGAKVVGKMKEMPTDDPLFGKGYVRADGRTIHDMYVFQVKSPEESTHPWDYYKLVATIPGEKAFRPLAEGGCPLIASKSAP